MTIVFPFYRGDAKDLTRLLKWLALLGGTQRHSALLCADADTPFNRVWDNRQLATTLFKDVQLITTKYPTIGWPQGANALFRCAGEAIERMKGGPWLWLETDCVPLKQNWLDQIEQQYLSGSAKVMGTIVPCNIPGLPDQHVSGCAIYPENFYSLAKASLDANPLRAFDLAAAPVAMPIAVNNPLFQCFWGEKDLPPTFINGAHQKRRPNEFTLDHIRQESVLFHRNKDGTLIELLQMRLFPNLPKTVRFAQEFIVALPFNNKDAPLQIECLKWMDEMGQLKRYDCLLSYDHATIAPFIEQATQWAKYVFQNVWTLAYPNPPKPTWPQAPNWAFQQTAVHIHRNIHRAWLWKEADMIPLKPDWIEQLQEEYQLGGKTFMGSVVPGMSHANGTSVFPSNLPQVCPSAMKCTNEAFDTAMKAEMMPHCHDAIRLMAHCWGLHGGNPHPIVGEPIKFDSPQQVKAWIPSPAVTFHRCKNTSLIEQLRKMKKP